MAPVIERVCEGTVLGEGPHWDVESQSLYFVDMPSREVHKYTPTTKTHTKVEIKGTDSVVSLIIPVEGERNTFLITMGCEVALIVWDGVCTKVSSIEKLGSVENIDGNRFNDGKADALGRLWAGTFQLDDDGMFVKGKGTFYNFHKGKAASHFNSISISNGVAFNKDSTKLFYIDSIKKTIDVFDFDLKKGTIENRQVLFTLSKHDIEGIPDGQTMDKDGNLWVAIFSGSKVIKIDSRKPETLLDAIVLPVPQVTSVTFGGRNLDELYVTTARVTLDNITKASLSLPENGAVYKITGLNAQGVPDYKFKL